MIKELMKLADDLDRKGLRQEADEVDAIIREAAWSPEEMKRYEELTSKKEPTKEEWDFIVATQDKIDAVLKPKKASLDKLVEKVEELAHILKMIESGLEPLNEIHDGHYIPGSKDFNELLAGASRTILKAIADIDYTKKNLEEAAKGALSL